MEQNEWILHEINQLIDQVKDNDQEILFTATKKLIKEQQKRIDQMEGELEGSLWSPRKWNDQF